MIEIEKKFSIDKEQIEKLERCAKFISEKNIQDTYFDTNDFTLTTKNIWLRKRQDRFELKVGINQARESVTYFDEIEDEKKILSFLGLKEEKDFSSSLQKANIFPFCTFITKRRKYQIDPYVIDLDYAIFKDFTYFLAEVECLVASKEEIPGAEKKLLAFAKSLGWDISCKPVLGKLNVFLQRKRKEHFQALVDAKVLSE